MERLFFFVCFAAAIVFLVLQVTKKSSSGTSSNFRSIQIDMSIDGQPWDPAGFVNQNCKTFEIFPTDRNVEITTTGWIQDGPQGPVYFWRFKYFPQDDTPQTGWPAFATTSVVDASDPPLTGNFSVKLNGNNVSLLDSNLVPQDASERLTTNSQFQINFVKDPTTLVSGSTNIMQFCLLSGG